MRAERHEGNGLQYITVVPDGYTPDSSYPLVVMLHGFGANMQDLAGLAPTINADGYVYACPNAPIPFQLGPGQSGFGWMTPRGGGTPEETANSEQLLSDFFDAVFKQNSCCLQPVQELRRIRGIVLRRGEGRCNERTCKERDTKQL